MADDDCLTEELVVRHGGQYDPELLQRLTLSGLRLARLGAGLARCTALRVLDLARNKLQHLDGVEVCASLERLLVARNELTRFGFVAGLAKLDHLDARANALQDVDAVAADLRPCAALASLELRSDDGSDANPCCAAPSYAATLRGALPALRVLDGASLALADAAADRARARSPPRPSTRRRRRPTTGSADEGFDDAAAPGNARPAGERGRGAPAKAARTGSARRWTTASQPPRRRLGGRPGKLTL